MKTVEELLADPKRWTKDAGARDMNNKQVSVDHPSAACWCLIGAMVCVHGHGADFYLTKCEVAKVLRKRVPPDRQEMPDASLIMWFNDDPDTTHADVMQVVREAHV